MSFEDTIIFATRIDTYRIQTNSTRVNTNQAEKKKSTTPTTTTSTINSSTSTSISSNSNSNYSTTKCKKCKVLDVIPGKAYCIKCYEPQRTPTKTAEVFKDSRGKIDFSKHRVYYVKPNDSDLNPLHWTTEKLKSQNRCFYCTELLAVHNKDEPCKKKYPFYSAEEVRTLKLNNLEIPVRGSKPTGAPLSP